MRNRFKPSPDMTDAGFTIPTRVYYEDTDAAGVVYYANYFRFCERARTEWLRHLGFEQSAMLSQQQIAFVVRSVEADYISPARLDDELCIHTQLVTCGRASLELAQRIIRGEELVFDSRITLACVDLARGRPTALPIALRSLLSDSPALP